MSLSSQDFLKIALPRLGNQLIGLKNPFFSGGPPSEALFQDSGSSSGLHSLRQK